MSIREIASRAGLSRMTLHTLLNTNKHSRISYDLISRVAFVLGVTVEDLLRDRPPESTEEKLAVEQLRDLMREGGPGGAEIRRAVDAAWVARFGAVTGEGHIMAS